MFNFIKSIFLSNTKIEFEQINFDKTNFYKNEIKDFYLDWVYMSCKYDFKLKKSLEKYKFFHNKDLYRVFLPYLIQTYNLYLKDNINQNNTIIIWIPMFFIRYFWRWFNQTYLFARNIDKNLKFLKIIKKIKHTKKQSHLSKKERLVNILNSFEIDKKYLKLIQDKEIIIVDDVVSTGSTANEIAKILKQNWAKKVYWLFLSTWY